MRRTLRRLLLRAQPLLRRGRLTVRAWRAWEGLLAIRGRRGEVAADHDGLPLPHAALRVRVVAEADPEVFLESGRAEARQLAEAAAAHGLEVGDAGRLLDFGCGCGRIIRHWRAHQSVEVHGTDHDAESIEWLGAALPFVRAHRNGLAPPLPCPDSHFGLVYAVSVFTHLTEELSRAWMAEMERILRPGGLLLFTVVAEDHLDRLLPRERAAFERGELVVQFEEGLGTNLCMTYHPRSYVERLTQSFDRLGTSPVGAQQLWVLRLRG